MKEGKNLLPNSKVKILYADLEHVTQGLAESKVNYGRCPLP